VEEPKGTAVQQVTKAPSKEEDIVSLVDDAWAYLKNTRSAFDQEVKEHIHFLLGDQWVRYMTNAHRYTKHRANDWTPTPVTNYLVKHYDRLVDLFTSGDILEHVDASTQDQSDIEASMAAQRALHAESRRLNYETDLLIPGAGWLILTGNAVLFHDWDAKAGKKHKIPKKSLNEYPVMEMRAICMDCGWEDAIESARERCAQCGGVMAQREKQAYGADGLPIVDMREEDVRDEEGNRKYHTFRSGELIEGAVNLLNWYPQPAKDFKHSRYVVEIDPWDLDKVKDVFGSKAKDIAAESLELDEFKGVNDKADQFQATSNNPRPKDMVNLKFFRHIADRRWKDGAFYLIAGNKVLHKGDLQCTDGQLPYTHAKYRAIPGSFWGAGPFSDMLSSQKRLNSVDSHIIQNRKQMINNQWLVPEGSGISQVTGQSGLIVRYSPHTTGGFKPERLQGVPLPNQVLDERAMSISDMDETGGGKDVLMGDIPPGPETGAAIEALQEQAFRRFGPAVKNWRGALAEHGKGKLLVIKNKWKETRLVRVLGENKETESFFYKGADFVHAEDMFVRVGVGMDASQTARRQKIMQAAQAGLLGDVSQASVRGKILEQMGIEGFESEYINDAKKARRVLNAIRTNMDIPKLLPTDNHIVQFEVLKEFTLTSDFEQMDESLQEIILNRAMEHKKVMQEEQQRIMQAAQATKGAGDAAAQAVKQSGAMGGSPDIQA